MTGALSRLHCTISMVPGFTLAVGVVFEPSGYLKIILFKVEVGLCWQEHIGFADLPLGPVNPGDFQ